MLKIATHNSVTGEKPKNFFSWLMIPFSRTQSKTIKEQYDAGCRMFDIRCRLVNCNNRIKVLGAHGLFITKKEIIDILAEINNFPDSCYVSITYEGIVNKHRNSYFMMAITFYKNLYKHIKWGQISAKYKDKKDIIVDWITISPAEQWTETKQGFIPLNGKTWQTYIPIPWLWKKIYYNKPKFNEEIFTYVDFL